MFRKKCAQLILNALINYKVFNKSCIFYQIQKRHIVKFMLLLEKYDKTTRVC